MTETAKSGFVIDILDDTCVFSMLITECSDYSAGTPETETFRSVTYGNVIAQMEFFSPLQGMLLVLTAQPEKPVRKRRHTTVFFEDFEDLEKVLITSVLPLAVPSRETLTAITNVSEHIAQHLQDDLAQIEQSIPDQAARLMLEIRAEKAYNEVLAKG